MVLSSGPYVSWEFIRFNFYAELKGRRHYRYLLVSKSLSKEQTVGAKTTFSSSWFQSMIVLGARSILSEYPSVSTLLQTSNCN